jgi:hypothetical protein
LLANGSIQPVGVGGACIRRALVRHVQHSLSHAHAHILTHKTHTRTCTNTPTRSIEHTHARTSRHIHCRTTACVFHKTVRKGAERVAHREEASSWHDDQRQGDQNRPHRGGTHPLHLWPPPAPHTRTLQICSILIRQLKRPAVQHGVHKVKPKKNTLCSSLAASVSTREHSANKHGGARVC